MNQNATTSATAAVPRPRNYYTEPARIDVAGLATAYRREGDGESALFLHGAGLTRMWLPFYAAMAGHSDFIAPEHPGFGETPLPEWLSGIDDVVLHYDEFLHQLGVEDCHLVGYSLGGWLAAALAATFPRCFRSLTLIAPLGIRVDWGDIPDIFQVGPEGLWQRLFEDPAAMEAVLPDVHNLDEIEHGYGEASAFARLAWTPRYDISLPRKLSRVACPGLIVLPERDRLVPEAIGLAYADALPDARVERVAGTGHALIVEQPDAVAALITAHCSGG
ncbi:MAG: alpha/beta fold hydrolase [Gammaproteobacteria bacterium]|jgi:pimeloyl-ACP methyl ester carboxylesterase